MNNNLVLFFEESLFKLYKEKQLKNYFSFLQKKIDSFLKDCDLNVYLAIEQEYLDLIKDNFSFSNYIYYSKSVKSFLESYNKRIVEENIQSDNSYTLLLSASYPLFSISKNKFIIEDSEKYLTDYYYGENFPEGIVGEVFRNTILEELIKLSNEKDYYHHNLIFDILLRNISMFDIDLIEGLDYYLPYRISLSLSDFSSLPLIALFFKEEKYIKNENYVELINSISTLDFFNIYQFKNIEWEEIESKISRLEILYTIPKTYIIELSSKCNFSCIHCPYPKGLKRDSEFINKSSLFNFINKNRIFFNDSVFIVGGFGEPLMHKDFNEIIEFLSENNKVYIETNGSFLSPDFYNQFKNSHNIFLVVSIDAYNEDTYKNLGKKMILPLLNKTIISLLDKYPENVFISYLRIPQNDDEIESFYSYFQKYEKNIIFRKYNSYSKKLDNLEVADLTPVKRFPCYHLRREIFILSDGKIALCYSDYNGQTINLNIDDNIDIIIDTMKNFYKQHCDNQHLNLCNDCNEFYTYFF